ncbi:MAG: LacI family transcriptional regulator [Candidatus Pacebacteria bacterium]|nr:LacI family transcriptional regulator [Candidatus Paceibacterota bacterium]
MTAPAKRATLESIAERVGVTKMTVSRALRGVGRISDGTRQRVREAAAELGYLELNQGILTAPSHRGKTDLSLRLIVAYIKGDQEAQESELSQELLRGLKERVAFCHGSVKVIVIESLKDILAAWDEHRAHGLVLRCVLPPAWVETLRQRGPVVYATSNDVYAGVDAVYCTEMRTAVLVSSYLHRHGHDNVAWFGFFDKHIQAYKLLNEDNFYKIASGQGPRYAAWSYFAQYGGRSTSNTVVILERDWNTDSLSDVVRRGLATILIARPRPSAIVAPGNFAGKALIEQAREVGLRIPEDISIISYGGVHTARQTTPPLTCVTLPHYTIGRTIPELVERRLADPDATPVTLQFEADIRDGETVASLSADNE